ncbi:ATP-binding protein [Halorubellus sp. PRR65]|uniref:GAF domain-containing sensor histidine kinase n=1 Tax=Halorubellus sp. PRR65 TaxID=3098148 RepID=UPI002B25D563|nr:ATP-binding protein [Halorubellus sp. PRR65]
MFDDTTSSVLESFPGAVFVVTRDGRVSTGNDRCSVLFGRDFDDLVGDHLRALVEEGLLASRTFEAYQDAAASLSAESATEVTFEARARRAGEGSWYLYEATVTPFRRDGETRGFVWSLTDLGTSERYDETVEALHDATRNLMTADTPADAYERCGEAADDVLGFPGTAVREYDPEADVLRHVTFGGRVEDIDERPPYPVDDSPHGRAFRNGKTVVDEIGPDDPYERDAFAFTMYVPIGEFGVLSLGKFGDQFDDSDRRFAEILAENTAAAIQQARQREQLHEQREALERQNERLDEFASVVAHDLRNPLSLGRGSFELYRETGDPGTARDVEYAFERMESIIEEVLTLAREGEDVDETTEVDVASVAREAWGSVSASASSLEVREPGVVAADRDRLLQVFENLFRNAQEHAMTAGGERDVASGEPDGGRAGVTVVVDALADGSGFFVADDGVGIPPGKRERVFEAGYSTSDGGTGLGLGIVSRITRAHGWEPAVAESEQGGARFEFHVA